MAYACGWTYDAEKIAAAAERVSQAGFQFSFSADRPSLSGWWKRQQAKGVHIVAAQQDEMKLNGKFRDPNFQSVGICVECGSERAIEDRHTTMLVNQEIVGVYTRIAGEVMYGYERHQRWGPTQPYGYKGRRNDGIMGADAAAYYTTIGCIARGVYDGIDLTKQQENLAIEWNNDGAPPILVEACKFHQIICNSSDTWDEYADAIAAKYWGWICLQGVFGMTQVIVGPYGTVEPDCLGPNYGHCTECCGVVTLPNGETGFLIQQSWSIDGPKYPPTIQVMGPNGEVIPFTLRPGSYCVRKSVLESIAGGQERISCDIPSQSSFRSLAA